MPSSQNTKMNRSIKLIIVVASVILALTSLSVGEVALGKTRGEKALQKILEDKTNLNKIVGSVIVTNDPKETVDYAKKKNLDVTHTADRANNKSGIVAVSELPSNPKVKELVKQEKVKVFPNYAYTTAFTPNDPQYSNQWNMKKISAPKAWDVFRGSESIVVAVIDTGILSSQTINGNTYSQPDFPDSRIWKNTGEEGMTESGDVCWDGVAEDKASNDCDDDENGFVDDWRGWDFMGGWRGSSAACPNFNDPSRYESPEDPSYILQDGDPQPYSCDSPTSPNTLNKNHYNGTCEAWDSACYVGHGTMVASVTASQTNNGSLVAGIDHNTSLMNIRALDGYGYGTSAHVVSSINYAVDKGADVINMSLATACGDDSFIDEIMEQSLANAASAGIVVVAASGNGGLSSGICYPASSTHAIAVGATGQDDKRLSYSNYSSKLDVVAPAGVPVANAPSAAINSNYYGNAHGTSLATPHVTGLAALLKARNPDFTHQDLVKHVKATATKVSGMGGSKFHKQYGYGRIDLYSAMIGIYGNIRLIECEGEKYLVERGIRHKRAISSTAVTMWQLSSYYFNADDPGCNYSTYSLPLGRILRSRTTGKEYFVTNGKAYYIHDSRVAKTWGITGYKDATYPQFDGDSIHFLTVVSKLHSHNPNMSASNIRVFECNDNPFMVERDIRRKRSITSLAKSEWGLSLAYYAPNDKGCAYPSYSLDLDRIIRSRNTGKEYLVDNRNAYWITSQDNLASWGISEDYETTIYPQYDGKSIHFLNLAGELPLQE